MLDEEEHLLAEKLKKSCDSNGKEVNITKSANFLHKLGLLYRERRHDKVSLIQSAALFNAALIRTSNNTVEIETDLKKLCKIILEEAEACNENANIINIAKIVKAMVKKMRMKTDSILQPVVRITEEFLEDEKFQAERHKINDIQSIQNEITETYSTIMDYVSNECSNIMGDPPEPCDFAVVGMGSIARKEVTPYSDFECVIVLETDAQKKTKYDGILEYFRWFTVIFQTILICLGETILPSVAIPSLNDFYGDGEDWFFDAYTKSGISFDGMMPHACKSPLGRQQNTKKKSWKTELIKPVDDMVKYLDSKENLKQGYHLADILTKTRFISGSKDVYENFNDKVKKKMSWQRTNNKEEQLFAINKQIEEDKKNLLVIDHMTNRIFSGKLNVKRTIYRSITIFIAALGGLYGIDFASCFDIIDALLYNQIISPDIAHKLNPILTRLASLLKN
ncbi:unnamed protein product [Clavelina lepadiformis]|uniref:Protein-PII uridylyltransferase N-terminal domain-containing protein n=1 Tax=Clavelina lepadiformis TaxID=159417 RepID=A0ABP0F5B9_CLALP